MGQVASLVGSLSHPAFTLMCGAPAPFLSLEGTNVIKVTKICVGLRKNLWAVFVILTGPLKHNAGRFGRSSTFSRKVWHDVVMPMPQNSDGEVNWKYFFSGAPMPEKARKLESCAESPPPCSQLVGQPCLAVLLFQSKIKFSAHPNFWMIEPQPSGWSLDAAQTVWL